MLVGMDEADCAAVADWFRSMEPGFVVSPCPAALLTAPGATLRQAVEGSGGSGGSGGATADAAALPAREWKAPPGDAPPVAFFSGMSGEEQVAVMEGWAENTGVEAPAFAAGARMGGAGSSRAPASVPRLGSLPRVTPACTHTLAWCDSSI